MFVVGGSHGADAGLDFAAALREAPGFSKVQMTGSESARYRDVPGVRFRLSARLAAPDRVAGRPAARFR